MLNTIALILLIFVCYIGYVNHSYDKQQVESRVSAHPVSTFTIKKVNLPPPPVQIPSDDIVWLAKNIYFEARNQTEKGKLAVLNVTLNRVYSSYFPNNIKDVVTQKNSRGCQFSWYCDGEPDIIDDVLTFNKIKSFVFKHLSEKNKIVDVTNGALYYHANYVTPNWSYEKRKTTVIGTHIFYK